MNRLMESRGQRTIRLTDGSRAEDSFGALSVTVPMRDHHMRTRSDALVFARRVWGPKAAITDMLTNVSSRDSLGGTLPMCMYRVVILAASHEDAYRDAMNRADSAFAEPRSVIA